MLDQSFSRNMDPVPSCAEVGIASLTTLVHLQNTRHSQSRSQDLSSVGALVSVSCRTKYLLAQLSSTVEISTLA